jgi:integrase
MEAKTFVGWCVKHKYLSANPLDEVEGVGRRRHGKAQLRVDESRKWLAKALELADAGDAGAIAASLSLLMGLRASEICERTVRDLDDQGRLLWVTKAKTANGVRQLVVPDVLRPYLVKLAEGKKPEAHLFDTHWRDWVRKSVQRVCKLAGVPLITAHGMRGTHSTLAVEAGATGNIVAASLGHGSPTVTFTSYVAPGTKESAASRRAFDVLQGGKVESAAGVGNDCPANHYQADSENDEGLASLRGPCRFRGAVGDRTPDL